MDEFQSSAHIKAIRLLKELTIAAIGLGLSYAEIELLMADADWNANAIKQFVHRRSSSRTSPKVRRLAVVVLDFLDTHDEDGDLADERSYVRGVLDSRSADIIKFYDQKFRASRSISSQLFFPDRYGFVRFDILNKSFLVISVEIISMGDQSYFSMSLQGGSGKKRVVVGSLHSTATNTHMVGLAFSVSEFASESDFDALSHKNLGEIHHLLSSNPIGVEELSFPNSAFKDTYFPVAFAGLDGGGIPIAGIGMLINEESLEDFGIHAATLSAQTADSLPRVAEALKKLRCSTQSVSPAQGGGWSGQ